MMAGIGGKNTRPEMILRRALHGAGFRYRLHARDLPGKPDLVLPRFRAAIFVHGCFWHRHANCHWCTDPASNRQFWAEKFDRNVERDERAVAALKQLGWRVAKVWECGLRSGSRAKTIDDLTFWLSGGEADFDSGIVRPRREAASNTD